MKISTKIRASLLGTALIPLVLFFGIAYLSIERTLIKSAETRLSLDADTYVSTVYGMLEQAEEEVDSWSKLETLQTVFTGEDLDLRMGLLLRNLNESTHFLDIWCVDTNGKIIAASNFYQVGKSAQDSLAISGSLLSRSYISGVVPFEESDKNPRQTVIISKPIYAAFDQETVIGSVIAFYNWDTVLSYTRRLNESYKRGHEQVQLYDLSGQLLAGSPVIHLEYLLNRNSHLNGASRPVEFVAKAYMDKGTVLEATRQLAGAVIWGALTVTLAVIIVSLLLARIISNPIISLSSTARHIAEGDLDEHSVYRSPDEIGQLALDLDVMRKNLKQHIQSLDETVLERTSELENTVTQLRKEMADRAAAETQVDMQQQQLVQADKMVSLGILVSGVAHEINNPNGLIGLNTSILKEVWGRAEPVLDEYAEEHGDFSLGAMNYSEMRAHTMRIFDELQSSSDRIKDIVSDLKEFSQKRSDREFELIDINQVVQSAIALVQKHLETHTEALSITLADDLPNIQGIFQRLEQVLVNLLLNAADSLPSTSCAIRIQTGYDSESHSVWMRIEDEGCGIKEDDFPYLTDPFFTTKRESGGTGLGLSVSSNIMHEHGGELRFQSTHESGTTAIMILPVFTEEKDLYEA